MNLTMGFKSYISDPYSLLGPAGEVTVGKYCSLAGGITFNCCCNHNPNFISTFPHAPGLGHPFFKGNITIGNNVWIGEKVTIMGGVTIHDGAVIGSCTVVTKDVPPYCLFAGNSGQIKRLRFTEQQIEKLLKIKWWDWPEEKIRINASVLMSANVDLLEALNES